VTIDPSVPQDDDIATDYETLAQADREVEAAIDVVARHVIAGLVDTYGGGEWESVPDVGEHDWQRISKRLDELAPFPGPAEYESAYALLSSRAENDA
jgi:hypothetical protein